MRALAEPTRREILHLVRDEEHTAGGAHRVVEVPFPEWVPADVFAAAELLSIDDALAQLPECLRG